MYLKPTDHLTLPYKLHFRECSVVTRAKSGIYPHKRATFCRRGQVPKIIYGTPTHLANMHTMPPAKRYVPKYHELKNHASNFFCAIHKHREAH